MCAALPSQYNPRHNLPSLSLHLPRHFSQLFNEDNLLKDVLHEVLHLEQLEVYIEEVIIVILVD